MGWGLITATCSGQVSQEEAGDDSRTLPMPLTHRLTLPFQPPGWYLQVGMSWNLTKV